MSGESKLETLGNNAGVNGRTGGAKGPAVLRRVSCCPHSSQGRVSRGEWGNSGLGGEGMGEGDSGFNSEKKKARKSNTSRMLSAEARVLLTAHPQDPLEGCTVPGGAKQEVLEGCETAVSHSTAAAWHWRATATHPPSGSKLPRGSPGEGVGFPSWAPPVPHEHLAGHAALSLPQSPAAAQPPCCPPTPPSSSAGAARGASHRSRARHRESEAGTCTKGGGW